MGKGDQKSRRGKVTAGSYGKRRPRKSNSAKKIPVSVLDEDNNKAPREKVRKEVGYPSDKSENADVEAKPKAAAKTKTADKDDKPKAAKTKKTEE